METGIRELSTELWMFLLITTILGAIIFNFGQRLNRTKAYIFLIIYAFFVFYAFGQAFHMNLTGMISDVLLSIVDWFESIL